MPDETLLGFDFGVKRIGVAMAERRLGSARALTVIDVEANDARFAAIGKLIEEWQVARLIVGRPLHPDGTPHEMTARSERFANQLRGRFGLPVEAVDERYSSVVAEAEMETQDAGDRPSRQSRLSWQQRKSRVDAEAARIILQSWLDSQSSPNSP